MRRRVGLALVGGLAVAVLPLVAAPVASGVTICDGHAATILGTAGADSINGTAGPDVIAALGGDDVVYGLAGNDRICGGAGDDIIHGGDGADRIRGNAGDDYLDGGPGLDTIWEGWGHDLIDAGLGTASRLYGRAGRDRIVLRQVEPGSDHQVDGGAGRDILDLQSVPVPSPDGGVLVRLVYFGVNLRACRCQTMIWPPTDMSVECSYPDPMGHSHVSRVEVVIGTGGNDNLIGDERPNRLLGKGGDDILAGNDGEDRLRGGLGNDVIYGQDGDDRLVGGPGTDGLDGGNGWDVCRGGESSRWCEGV